MNLDLGIYREGVTIQKDWVDVDKPARLILRLLFGFASDSVSIWQTQPIYKYWDGNAVSRGEISSDLYRASQCDIKKS